MSEAGPALVVLITVGIRLSEPLTIPLRRSPQSPHCAVGTTAQQAEAVSVLLLTDHLLHCSAKPLKEAEGTASMITSVELSPCRLLHGTGGWRTRNGDGVHRRVLPRYPGDDYFLPVDEIDPGHAAPPAREP